ncbi:MAG: hypothetical protein ACP5NZ_00390 [Nanobdellota archaeon]
MDIAEGYQEGVNSFLNGEVDEKDLWDITKAIVYYPLYLVPGVLPYREVKKPKGERHTGKAIISTVGLITAGAILKLGIVYAGKGVATGNWNPFNFDKKYKTEQIEDLSKKENKSEKLNYLERELDSQDLLNE